MSGRSASNPPEPLVPLYQVVSTTWNGSVSADWWNPLNWSNGVPDSTIDVVIGVSSPSPEVPVEGARIHSLTVNSGGLLSWERCGGALYIYGTMTLTQFGTVNMDTCSPSNSLVFINNVQINNGGNFLSGNGLIELQGASWQNSNGSNFDAGTSTVTLSGTADQTITGDISFYNAQVTNSSGTINFTGTVVVENSLVVEEGGSIGSADNLVVQGELIDYSGTVTSTRPFITSVTTPALTTLKVVFSEAVDDTTSQQTGNYSVNNSIGTPSLAVRDTSDHRIVRLTLPTALTEGLLYEMTVNNVKDDTSGGDAIAANTRKRFTASTQSPYYSITSGNWTSTSSWSRTSHTGAPATSIPGSTSTVYVGSGHTITLDAAVTINNTLRIDAGGVLVTGTQVIDGTGNFQLVSGGSMHIGSPDGISSGGAIGNIRTASRSFSTGATYVFDASQSQITGSGLPSTTSRLTVNLASGDTLTLTQPTTISELLSLSSGVFSVGAQSLTVSDTITGAGALVSDPAGNVTYAAAGAGQTVIAGTYGSLTFTGGAKTLASAGSIRIAGSFDPGTEIHTLTGSTIEFRGTTSQSIPALAYHHLTITNSSDSTLPHAKTVLGTFSVAGTLQVDAGNTLDMSGYTISSMNAGVNNGRIRWTGTNVYIGGGGVTEFYGSSDATVALGAAYGTLWFRGSGTKTIAGPVTVANAAAGVGVSVDHNLTIGASGLLTIQGTRLRVAGALHNDGKISLE